MLGLDVSRDNLPGLTSPIRPTRFVGIKSPMFSFTRLRGADPVLGVEMASTGEVACFGENKHEAFLKALLASNFELPKEGILLSAQADFLPEITHAAYTLHRLGFKLYATPETATFLAERGIPNQASRAGAARVALCAASRRVEDTAPCPRAFHKHLSPYLPHSPARALCLLQSLPYPTSGEAAEVARSPLLQLIRDGKVDLVINVPNAKTTQKGVCTPQLRAPPPIRPSRACRRPSPAESNYLVRRTAVDFAVPLLTNVKLVTMFADAMDAHAKSPMVGLVPSSLYEYYRAEKPSDAWTAPTEFH
jgi:carbamoyl-phosphate synthase (ammonia)